MRSISIISVLLCGVNLCSTFI